MNTHLITGFPGFLASEFIERILSQTDDHFICLVQEKFVQQSQVMMDQIIAKNLSANGRIQLITGDITLKGLGIQDQIKPEQKRDIQTVDHFAAVYDLNVSESVARLINVTGTENVLDYIADLPSLSRFNYVSTCYVSGRIEGIFRETDLEMGQKFNNHYESSKFEAEVLVKNLVRGGLPATVFRPSVVVGNSKTGDTQKFDGPYYVMQWLLRQNKVAWLPDMGHGNETRINVVPSDFVLDAMVQISKSPQSMGKTFALADPHPPTIEETIQIMAKACDKKVARIPLPKRMVKGALGAVPGLETWLGIPRSALDYFVHPTLYDVSQTHAALMGTGIECPQFQSYAATLVNFMRAHPNVRNQAMR